MTHRHRRKMDGCPACRKDVMLRLIRRRRRDDRRAARQMHEIMERYTA
jgi:hypothetical protein